MTKTIYNDKWFLLLVMPKMLIMINTVPVQQQFSAPYWLPLYTSQPQLCIDEKNYQPFLFVSFSLNWLIICFLSHLKSTSALDTKILMIVSSSEPIPWNWGLIAFTFTPTWYYSQYLNSFVQFFGVVKRRVDQSLNWIWKSTSASAFSSIVNMNMYVNICILLNCVSHT